MAYKIDPEKCVACGSCIGECPVEAISAGDVYVIDADTALSAVLAQRFAPTRLSRCNCSDTNNIK